jgi:signal transduction histidine kinase
MILKVDGVWGNFSRFEKQMQDLSLHILDIVENSFNAGSSRIDIRIIEDGPENLLTLEISDDGAGMDEATLNRALYPFYTSKQGKRVGLGLALLAQAAREAGGRIVLESRPEGGTSVAATFEIDHPDRKPMGDVEGTIWMLQITHPETTLRFEHIKR